MDTRLNSKMNRQFHATRYIRYEYLFQGGQSKHAVLIKSSYNIPIGSMCAIYGNIYHQYSPFMLVYIPAPWIRHGICDAARTNTTWKSGGIRWIPLDPVQWCSTCLTPRHFPFHLRVDSAAFTALEVFLESFAQDPPEITWNPKPKRQGAPFHIKRSLWLLGLVGNWMSIFLAWTDSNDPHLSILSTTRRYKIEKHIEKLRVLAIIMWVKHYFLKKKHIPQNHHK